MKKFVFLLFASLMISRIDALPLGNPIQAYLLRNGIFLNNCCCYGGDGYECSNLGPVGCSLLRNFNFRVGFWGDYVFNRKLQIVRNDKAVQKTKLITNAGIISLAFREYVEVFTTLGVSQFRIETPLRTLRVEPAPLEEGYAELETDTNFSWSVGARALVFKCGSLGIGVEGQYLRTKPNVNFVSNSVSVNSEFMYSNETVEYREWQAGVGVSYLLCLCGTELVPYLGLRWNECKMNINNIILTPPSMDFLFTDLQNERSFGVSLGLTLVKGAQASVTLEGCFINEKAVHFNALFRF